MLFWRSPGKGVHLPGCFIPAIHATLRSTMNKPYNLRAITAKAVAQVIEHGQSLSLILPTLQPTLTDKDRALVQELCFGIMRTLPLLEWYIRQLMAKPLTGK